MNRSQECQSYPVSSTSFIPTSSQPDLLMVSTRRFQPTCSRMAGRNRLCPVGLNWPDSLRLWVLGLRPTYLVPALTSRSSISQNLSGPQIYWGRFWCLYSCDVLAEFAYCAGFILGLGSCRITSTLGGRNHNSVCVTAENSSSRTRSHILNPTHWRGHKTPPSANLSLVWTYIPPF